MCVLSLLQACLEEEDCVIIHVYLQDIIQMKRVGKIQGWSRLSQEWIKLINSQSIEDVPSGTKCSHGMVSIVHYALCTNPWSTWEFYVGLGMFLGVCVNRKIPYNPWRMTSNQGCVVQVQVEHHEEIMLVAFHPLWLQCTCEGVPKSDSPIVEYGGAIN